MGWHWLGRRHGLISDPLNVAGGPETTNGHTFLCLRSARRVARVLAVVATGDEYMLHAMI
jgi:hypothetical protein